MEFADSPLHLPAEHGKPHVEKAPFEDLDAGFFDILGNVEFIIGFDQSVEGFELKDRHN